MNLNEFLIGFKELDLLSTVFRLSLAILCGGIIGFDRGRRRRPAGFRTHILVCMGAALTMLTGQYIYMFVQSHGFAVPSDISRLSAQVINGIGFLGAGTIIVTGRQEIVGLTTAAGLWASACMGIAIGAGFYFCAILGCFLILFSITAMRGIESFILSQSRNMNVYVELTDFDDISVLIDIIKSQNVKFYDVEINKASPGAGSYTNVVFSLRLPKKKAHSDIMASLATIKSIRSLEEI